MKRVIVHAVCALCLVVASARQAIASGGAPPVSTMTTNDQKGTAEAQDARPREQAATRGPDLQVDPDGPRNLRHIYACRFADCETLMTSKLLEVKKADAAQSIPSRDYVVILRAVVVDDTLTSWPGTTRPYHPIIIVVRTSRDSVALGGLGDNTQFAGMADLDRANAAISEALDALGRSRLPYPAAVVVQKRSIDETSERDFNTRMFWAIKDIRATLKLKGTVLLCSPVPDYLLGGRTFHELFGRLETPGYGRLPDLISRGPKNASRDYSEADGTPRCFYLSTSNSAPVEFDPGDLPQLASKKIASARGLYSVTVTTKNGAAVTFGGLSAVNADFLKPGVGDWGAVVGLSSLHGFTISVAYRDGVKSVRVSGEDIVRNTANVQDRLPRSVVQMIALTAPGPELLLQDLLNPVSSVRRNAVSSLAGSRDPRVLEALVRALADQEASVRRSAVSALKDSRDPRAVEALVGALADGNDSVRVSVEASLVALGPPAVEPLITALQRPDSSAVAATATVLVRLGDKRAAEPLIAVLLRSSTRSEMAALGALKEVRDTALVDVPVAALQDRSVAIRAAAATALEETGSLRAIQPLITALADREVMVVQPAAAALVKIGTPAMEPLLRRLESDSTTCPWVRITLAACGHNESESYVARQMCENRYPPSMKHAVLSFSDSDAFGRVLARIESEAADPGMRSAAQVWRLKGRGWHYVIERAVDDSTLLESTLEAFEYSCSNLQRIVSPTECASLMVRELCAGYIALGNEAIVPRLVGLLNVYGTEEMGTLFLNSGQSELERAAAQWAGAHGYQRTTVRGGAPEVTWGSGRKQGMAAPPTF